MYCTELTGDGWWKYNYLFYDTLEQVTERLSGDDLNAAMEDEFIAVYDLRTAKKINLQLRAIGHISQPIIPEPYTWIEIKWEEVKE